MEIVSTRNQDVGTLITFCKSLKDRTYFGFRFRGKDLLQNYANTVLGGLLEAVCQRFHLPLTQYWCYIHHFCLLHQFSHSDSENLAPWSQFKDVCLRNNFRRLLGFPYGSHGAFFCRNISALSIASYPLAHYAQNCGSIALFTIYLEKEEEYGIYYVLEFFLPSQEMDNDYPQTLLTSIWTTVRDSLPNYKLSVRGGKLEQVLSVGVINSSTHTEPESFEVHHPQSSLPHYEGSELTHTLKLFEEGPDPSSNSNSYEEAAAGETSIRILLSEEYFKTKGKAMAAERDQPVEGSIIEEAPYAISNADIQNAAMTSDADIQNATMTSASHHSRFQTKKTLCQQQEGTMFLENEGYTSQQLLCISQQLFQDSTEQEDQVLAKKKPTPNTLLFKEISTAATSKRIPECVEQILVDELEEELPNKYNEPPASKRLKKSKIPCTAENIRKLFGRPLKDAAESFGLSVSTFKRRCRGVDVEWWESGKSQKTDGKLGTKNFSLGTSSLPNRRIVTHSSQDFNMITVKVTYDAGTIRFELPSSSGIEELENSVIERLHLDRKSFGLKYQDDEDDWIDITCDEDVRECMKVTRSFNKPIIKMKLGPPINSYQG